MTLLYVNIYHTYTVIIAWTKHWDYIKTQDSMLLQWLCNPILKVLALPADQEAADVMIMSSEQSSITINDQDDTSELSQPDQPPLPPKMYQTS